MRDAVLAWLLTLVLWTWAGPAFGQNCHMPDLGSTRAERFRVSGRAVFATYRNPVFAGEYQGYFATASYAQRWFFVELQLPGYRLVRNGLAERGLGDVALDLRGAVWRPDTELALGLELAATLPSGDANRGLGMGHLMLMPGAWLSWERGALRLFAQLAYGRMVSSGPAPHRDHAGPAPLVNPMNRSELVHAYALSYGFAEHLFAGGRLLGAVPIAVSAGRARAIATLGFGARFGPLEFAAELQIPLVGSPFTVRSTLTLAAIF